MKSKVKKNILKTLSVLSVLSLGVCFGVLGGVNVLAEEIPNISMVDGASIRLNEYSGVRFTAEVDKEYYDAIEGNKQAGMFIIPYDLLGENEINENLDANLVKDVKTEVWRADGKSFNSVLYNIPETQYGRQLAARAYVKTDAGYEWSAKTVVRSMAEVASKALVDGKAYNGEPFTADEINSLNAYVDGSVASLAFNEADYCVTVGGEISLQYTVTAKNAAHDLSSLQAKFVSEDTSIVTVDENGKLKGVAAGTATVKAVLGTKEASVEVTVATHVIKTAEDLDNFVKVLVGYGTGSSNTQSSAMYAVLDADINYNGGNLVSNTNQVYNTNWCGVFDGRGHVISNITVGQGGLFGYIRGGTVKNLGLVNVIDNKKATDFGGLLACYLTSNGSVKGMVDNCFVEGLFTNASTAFGAAIAEPSYNDISNCIVMVSGAKYAICGRDTTAYTLPKKSYAISPDALYAYRTEDSENVLFRSSRELLAKHSSLTSADGWNKQWKVENGQLSFGSYTLQNVETLAEEFYVKASADAAVLDLSKYGVTEVVSASIGGVATEGFTFADGKLTFDKSLFANNGDYVVKLSVKCGEVACEMTATTVVATDIIKSATDFDDFMKVLAGYGSGKTNTQSSSMYAVLASDIDYNGGNMVTNVGRTSFETNWCGVFDGRGHVISNLTVDRGGVFGYVRGGTVKNLGLVNITNNKAAKDTGGLLCMMLTSNAIVDNCFVQGSFTNASTTNGGGIAEFSYSGCKVKNCITVVSGGMYAICGQATGITPTTSFGVSSDAVYAFKTTTTNYLFKTMAEFTKKYATLPNTGWNTYWRVTGSQITFGSYTTNID